MTKRVKTAAVFTGVDSACRSITVAYRKDGAAFWRTHAYNGYGLSPTPWRPLEDAPALNNALAAGLVEWGFKTLRGGECDGLRVPA